MFQLIRSNANFKSANQGTAISFEYKTIPKENYVVWKMSRLVHSMFLSRASGFKK